MIPRVAVTSLGSVTAGAVVWRARGALYLSVVVKATFALVPEARMTVVAPDPIAATEQPDLSGAGLRTAGDLAPYLGQPEIWLIGHAEAPPRPVQRSTRVELAIVRAGAVRLAKTLDVDLSGATGSPPIAPILGMGPVAAHWPLRSRWLSGADRRRLTSPVPDIPDTLHWQYFQSSPLDQRLDSLCGDETLVLSGIWLRRPMLRTQLPAARSAARLFRREARSLRDGETISLVADTLQVDVDRQRCSILSRGRVKLTSERELDSLHVVAGLELPGQSLQWRDPFEAEQARPAHPSRAAARVAQADGTALISDEALQSILGQRVTPFEGPRAPCAAAPPARGGTQPITDEVIARLGRQPSLPFVPAPAKVESLPRPPDDEMACRAEPVTVAPADIAPPSMLIEIDAPSEGEGGLGAELLAAMAEGAL